MDDHKGVLLIDEKTKNFFPQFYKLYNGNLKYDIKVDDKFAECIIMEKMDNDLSNYILESCYYKSFSNFNDYHFFYEMLPKINNRNIIPTNFINDNGLEYFKNIKKKIKHNIYIYIMYLFK